MSANKKSVYLILLLLVFTNINVEAAGTPDATNSSIIIASNINVLTVYSITVNVKDISNANVDVPVHLTTTDGQFSNNLQYIDGNSVSGQFVVTLTSPSISFLESNRTVAFNATMDYGGADIEISTTTLLTHEDNRAIVNSQSNLPTTLYSGEIFEMNTLVEDINNNVISDIQVTYTSDFGSFSNQIGLSDLTGYYNTTFTAPSIDPSFSGINLTISILIEASFAVNLTLSANVSIVFQSASSLTVSLDSPSILESGSSTSIAFEVHAGVSPAFGGTISLSTTSGSFTGGLTSADLSINETGFASIEWSSPSVQDNTTVSFGYEILYLNTLNDLNSTGDFDILVYYLVKDLNVTISVEKASIKQNETNIVTVSVKELVSGTPVDNIAVSFSTGVGVWTESASSDYVGNTNSQGVVQATFNASSVILPTDQYTAVITITVSSTLFNPAEEAINFTLISIPPSYNFTAKPKSIDIIAGATVTIDLHAYINDLDYVNATFSLFATAGEFAPGEVTLRDKTDNDGLLTIIWDSSSLNSTQVDLKVFINVELVNSGLDQISIEINISPDPANITSNNTNAGTGGFDDILSNPGTLAAIIAALLALIGIGVFVTKKMK